MLKNKDFDLEVVKKDNKIVGLKFTVLKKYKRNIRFCADLFFFLITKKAVLYLEDDSVIIKHLDKKFSTLRFKKSKYEIDRLNEIYYFAFSSHAFWGGWKIIKK
jgi:hypothetical protein